jgi:hypothetical protein
MLLTVSRSSVKFVVVLKDIRIHCRNLFLKFFLLIFVRVDQGDWLRDLRRKNRQLLP